jgi:hypothetical protein
MVRLIFTAVGFVLVSWAVGLVIWAGYEVSLIFTGYYSRGDQGAIAVLIGLILMTAAAIGLGGRALMHRGRRTTRPASR